MRCASPLALTALTETSRAASSSQALVERQVYEMARAVEASVDDELHRLEKMDGDELEDIRRRRLEAMKTSAKTRKSLLERGHGVVNDLDDERGFFDKMKGEDKMIVHFYRRGSWPCEVMDAHCATIARKHTETLVCRIDAEKSPFLTDKLKIWMLPTLACIRNTKVVDYIVGFDDVGGTDDFPTEHLRLVLASKGVITYEGGDNDVDANPRRAGGGPPKDDEAAERPTNIRRGAKMALNSDDEDSDFD